MGGVQLSYVYTEEADQRVTDLLDDKLRYLLDIFQGIFKKVLIKSSSYRVIDLVLHIEHNSYNLDMGKWDNLVCLGVGCQVIHSIRCPFLVYFVVYFVFGIHRHETTR